MAIKHFSTKQTTKLKLAQITIGQGQYTRFCRHQLNQGIGPAIMALYKHDREAIQPNKGDFSNQLQNSSNRLLDQ
jgi:hypothetical protein